jgi:hypothetical protein
MPIVEKTFVLQATVPANLPANSTVAMNITIDPQAGSKTEYDVPITESWVLDDLYITSSQSPDGVIKFKRNRDEVVGQSAPVNTLLVSNPSRPSIGKKVWGPTQILSADYITLAAQGSSATTVTVYAKFKIFR